MERSELLVSAADLPALLDGAQPPVLLDVRWRLNQPDGHADFLAGHIPGARYVALDDVLAEHGPASAGRHPLPSAERLGRELARLGVTAESQLIAYDNADGWAAARAWWVLRNAGLNVRVLDGGLPAWLAAGGALEKGESAWAPTLPMQLELGQLASVDIDDAAALGQAGRLLDARAPERYLGEVEPIDPKAGHIPGARNAPVSHVFDEHGCYRSAAALRAHFDALHVGAEPVGVYCGSGVSATPLVIALLLAGASPTLYAGSWSQWSNQPDRQVETAPRST